MQIALTTAQARTLANLTEKYAGANGLLLTTQGFSVYVAFDEMSFTIDIDGKVLAQ